MTPPKLGDRIELVYTPRGDACPIKPGTAGVVTDVRRYNSLHSHDTSVVGGYRIDVEWDDGQSFPLVCPQDKYRTIKRAPQN